MSILSVYQIILSNWIMEQHGFKSSYSTHAWKLGFLIFLKSKDSFAPQMILSDHSYFVFGSSPRHIFEVCLLFDHPTSTSLCGVSVWMINLAHLPCICCRVKSRIHGGKRHTLRSKKCMCVEYGETILLCLI
jgi:hypothetical protein